jgi:hypothetical protein
MRARLTCCLWQKALTQADPTHLIAFSSPYLASDVSGRSIGGIELIPNNLDNI